MQTTSRSREAALAVREHLRRTRPDGIEAPIGFDVATLVDGPMPLPAALGLVAARGRWTLRMAGSDRATRVEDPTWYDIAAHAYEACLEEDGGRFAVVTGCRQTAIVGHDGRRELRVEAVTLPI